MSSRVVLATGVMLFLFTMNVRPQDKVVLENGEEVTGEFKVRYAEEFDYITQKGSKKKIKASQIKTIVLAGQKKYIVKEINFLHEELSQAAKKVVFLNELLTGGEVSLYQYHGKEFQYVLEKKGFFKTLQNQPFGIDEPDVVGFKATLISFLDGCIERSDINNSKLKKEDLIYLVNKYNICINNEHVPNITAKPKKTIFYFGLSIGTNRSNLSLVAPILKSEISGMRRVGAINQTGIVSKGIELGFDLRKAFRRAEKFSFRSSFLIRSFDFYVESLSGNFDIDRVKFNEIDLVLGVSYQQKIYKNFSVSINPGANFWFLANKPIINYNNQVATINPVIASQSVRASGTGAILGVDILYNLNERTAVFFSTNKVFWSNSDRLTSNGHYINSYKGDNFKDNLNHIVSFSIGFRAKYIY